MERRTLSAAQVEESNRFGQAALAAAGHVVTNEEVYVDLRLGLEGEITFDEAIERAGARARR